MSHSRIFLHAPKVMQRNVSRKSISKEWCGAVSTVDWGSQSHSSPRKPASNSKEETRSADVMVRDWWVLKSTVFRELPQASGHLGPPACKTVSLKWQETVKCVLKLQWSSICGKLENGQKPHLILLVFSKFSISRHRIVLHHTVEILFGIQLKIAICSGGAVHILTTHTNIEKKQRSVSQSVKLMFGFWLQI